MDDSQLLSAFQELSRPRQGVPPRPRMVFDVCQPGVVLRAILFVEAVMAVAAVFGAPGWADWLQRLAVLSGAALPVDESVAGIRRADDARGDWLSARSSGMALCRVAGRG